MYEDFETIMLPLNIILKMHFDRVTKNQIKEIQNKYSDTNKNLFVHKEIDEVLEQSVITCFKYLGKKYRKYLLSTYYNEQGLMFYMYSYLYKESQGNNFE